ncbi:MAG: putative quorum-sensing-regulated virulence factor [Solirubrobacterales bacterium]
MTPRDYQLDFVDACHRAWAEHDAVLGVLPTGMGKTVCFVEIASRWQDGRVLIIAPQIELVGQAAKKIRQHTGISPGIEQAHNRSNETVWGRSPFVVASKSTLLSVTRERVERDKHGVLQRRPAARRYERLQDIGLVIVDEAHEGMTPAFLEILNHYKQGGAKVLGVTATPRRHDGKSLKLAYEVCAYQMGIRDAIDQGWLVGPKSHCLQLKSLDLSKVGTKSTGDFKDRELAEALEEEKVVYEIAALTAAESGNLKTVVYCESITQARQVAAVLSSQHERNAQYISSQCTSQKRREVLESFTDDPAGVQIVCNVGILTTGWDFPGLEHIVMARPTKSLPLYTQMLGRGTRPLEGVVDFPASTPELRRQAIATSRKPHFKLTDLRDNSLQHKLVSAVDVLGGSMDLGEEVDALVRKMLERSAEAVTLLDAIAEAKETIAGEVIDQITKALQAAEAARTAAAARTARKLLGQAIQRAKEALEGDDRPAIRDMIARAQEEQEEFERLERERLARVNARADYDRRPVDPFDATQRGQVVTPGDSGPTMKFGKFKGQPLSKVPVEYLQWAVAADMPKWRKGPCWAELKRRKNPPATDSKPVQPSSAPSAAERLTQMLQEI